MPSRPQTAADGALPGRTTALISSSPRSKPQRTAPRADSVA